MFPVRPGVRRVDIELPRDKVTGKRRRISRYVEGTRNEAEVALSRLRVADREKRLPSGGTSARSVRAALDIYLAARDVGLDKATTDSYVSLLEKVFLIHRLPAWGKTLTARSAATPKVHVLDSAVAARLLRLTPEKLATLDPTA